jgi:hypothetical protein
MYATSDYPGLIVKLPILLRTPARLGSAARNAPAVVPNCEWKSLHFSGWAGCPF